MPTSRAQGGTLCTLGKRRSAATGLSQQASQALSFPVRPRMADTSSGSHIPEATQEWAVGFLYDGDSLFIVEELNL